MLQSFEMKEPISRQMKEDITQQMLSNYHIIIIFLHTVLPVARVRSPESF